MWGGFVLSFFEFFEAFRRVWRFWRGWAVLVLGVWESGVLGFWRHLRVTPFWESRIGHLHRISGSFQHYGSPRVTLSLKALFQAPFIDNNADT